MRVVLPKAVATRHATPRSVDPVVRDELPHIAHRDVADAWLARSVWYARVPLLAVPAVVSLVSSGCFSTTSGGLSCSPTPEMIPRAFVRSREHDADLRAAQAPGGASSVANLLRLAVAPAGYRGTRSLLPNHPSREQRLAVVAGPGRIAGMRFLDGFTAALLAALVQPFGVSTLTPLLAASGRNDVPPLVAALIGGSVGLWRSATVLHVVGGPSMAAPAAAAVAAGLVVGQLVSLAHSPASWSGCSLSDRSQPGRGRTGHSGQSAAMNTPSASPLAM